MGRRSDPRKVLAAQLSGTAARYGHVKAITRDEALADLTATLAGAGMRPGSPQAVEALTEAAALFVNPTEPGTERWYPVAAGLLAEAGADLERAAEIRRQRGSGLSFRPP